MEVKVNPIRILCGVESHIRKENTVELGASISLTSQTSKTPKIKRHIILYSIHSVILEEK